MIRGGWLPALVISTLLTPTIAGAQQDAGTRAASAYSRAIDLEAEGNQAAALPLLWEAAGLAPHDADIQNRLGEALERMGALDAAVGAYRQSLAARPGFRQASSNLILALGKAGRGAEAVERARALVDLAPDDPDRFFTLGLAQSEMDVAGAMESFRRALLLAPGHVLARYNLALVLKRVDRLDQALDQIERVLAIEPRAEAHYTRGIIYWHQGHLDRAVEALREAVRIQPRSLEALTALGSVLKARGDWRGAATALRRAIELGPDQPAPHYALSQVLRLGGDDRGAREQLATVEKLRADAAMEQEAMMWTAAGTRKLDGGDLAGALELFERATAVNDRYAPAYYQMGRTLQGLGRPDAARRAFSKAAELNPSLVRPRNPGMRDAPH
jgi:tetratricopeptide (TPR) repeat protein